MVTLESKWANRFSISLIRIHVIRYLCLFVHLLVCPSFYPIDQYLSYKLILAFVVFLEDSKEFSWRLGCNVIGLLTLCEYSRGFRYTLQGLSNECDTIRSSKCLLMYWGHNASTKKKLKTILLQYDKTGWLDWNLSVRISVCYSWPCACHYKYFAIWLFRSVYFCGASVASEQQHKQDLRRIYRRENEFSNSSLFIRMHCISRTRTPFCVDSSENDLFSDCVLLWFTVLVKRYEGDCARVGLGLVRVCNSGWLIVAS